MWGSLRRWLLFAAVVAVGLAACTARRATPPLPIPLPPSTVIAETGASHNLRDRSGQVIAVAPGDLLVVPLIGERGSNYQWSFRTPVTGGYLSLKRHTVTDRDPRLKKGESLSEWVFKVEKAAAFDLKLVYENPLARQAPVRVFAVKVFSDRPLSALPPLLLDEPKPQAETPHALTISGYVRGEATVNYRLVAENEAVIASGTISVPAANGKDGYSSLQKPIRFSRPSVPSGTLEVSVAENQPPINVPLTFRPDLQTVMVFFSNQPLDAGGDCAQVFAVKRYVLKTQEPWQAALLELLRGPQGAEYRSGYRTNLPGGVKLTSVVRNDRTIAADFNRSLNRHGGGRCRIEAIRAQIEKTLQQFIGVKEVDITVDGASRGVLEP